MYSIELDSVVFVAGDVTVSTSVAFTGNSSFGEPYTHSLRKEYIGPWPTKDMSKKTMSKEYK